MATASDAQLDEWRVACAKLVAKAWSDQAFKAQLLSDPGRALAEAGAQPPSNVSVKVVEDTDNVVHLVLPPPPPEGELSDESLDKVAGGGVCKTGNTAL